MRIPEKVFADHLKRRFSNNGDDTILHDYSEDVVTISPEGVFLGFDGVKKQMEELHKQIPGATYNYKKKFFKDNFAMLVWSAESPPFFIEDGIDSYFIRDNKIIAQTIYYSIKRK
jgi:hypothetical protein